MKHITISCKIARTRGTAYCLGNLFIWRCELDSANITLTCTNLRRLLNVRCRNSALLLESITSERSLFQSVRSHTHQSHHVQFSVTCDTWKHLDFFQADDETLAHYPSSPHLSLSCETYPDLISQRTRTLRISVRYATLKTHERIFSFLILLFLTIYAMKESSHFPLHSILPCREKHTLISLANTQARSHRFQSQSESLSGQLFSCNGIADRLTFLHGAPCSLLEGNTIQKGVGSIVRYKSPCLPGSLCALEQAKVVWEIIEILPDFGVFGVPLVVAWQRKSCGLTAPCSSAFTFVPFLTYGFSIH